MTERPEERLARLSTRQPELLDWTLPGLERRSIILTGAGSGIGAAAARALAAAGANVFATDRDAEGLAATAASIPTGRVETLAIDLLAEGAPAVIVESAHEAFGAVTSIVNMAGAFRVAPVAEVTREQLDFLLAVNVYAPLALVQAAIPRLAEAAPAQIVLCGSSTSAYRGTAGALAYITSKHALLGLMRALAVELAPQGIRVNSISPGTTVSPINHELFAREGWAESVAQKNPNGRIAEPHEHVGAIGYLLSDLAKHVFGQDIAIDGGRLAMS